MELVKLFNYNGNNVTFKNENGVTFVNATEMAKPFGKQPSEYLRLPSTKALIEAIMGKSHIELNQLVVTIRGGSTPGTWLHEYLAIDFAQWLSIDFKLWCNDRIKELLTTGKTELPISQSDDEIILRAVTTLQTRVEDYKLRLLQANNTIIEQAPVVQYANDVLSSPDLISTTVIAKDLGMSANSLNKILRSRGVIYKQAETWVLYSKYQNKDYTHTKTHTHYDSEGKKRTSIHTYWTQKGRLFIHDLLNNQIKSA